MSKTTTMTFSQANKPSSGDPLLKRNEFAKSKADTRVSSRSCRSQETESLSSSVSSFDSSPNNSRTKHSGSFNSDRDLRRDTDSDHAKNSTETFSTQRTPRPRLGQKMSSRGRLTSIRKISSQDDDMSSVMTEDSIENHDSKVLKAAAASGRPALQRKMSRRRGLTASSRQISTSDNNNAEEKTPKSSRSLDAYIAQAAVSVE